MTTCKERLARRRNLRHCRRGRVDSRAGLSRNWSFRVRPPPLVAHWTRSAIGEDPWSSRSQDSASDRGPAPTQDGSAHENPGLVSSAIPGLPDNGASLPESIYPKSRKARRSGSARGRALPESVPPVGYQSLLVRVYGPWSSWLCDASPWEQHASSPFVAQGAALLHAQPRGGWVSGAF